MGPEIRRSHLLIRVAVAVSTIAIVAGCAAPVAPTASPATSIVPSTSSPSPSPSPEPSPSPSPEPSPSPLPSPSPTPELVPAPLTGVLVSPKDARRHPIAVMIDDLSPARPQSGFSAASIVWHAPAEGGIPRYMMIFGENQPGLVGPVRSARLYYVLWASEWKAVYAHAGGSPQALARLRKDGNGRLVFNADQFRFGTPEFWRVKNRFAPHNLYTDGKQLRKIATQLKATDKPMEPVWNFADPLPLDERPVGGRIQVRYPANTIRYDYDRTTNTYLRSVTKEGKQKDASNGQRVAPTNVIVMVVRFGPLNDDRSHHRLEARLVGKGKAWISTNGKTIVGTWRKKSDADPTRFYDAAGKEVTLTRGQTFVQVMPDATTVKITAGKKPPAPQIPQRPEHLL